jgi:hypothetical protein
VKYRRTPREKKRKVRKFPASQSGGPSDIKKHPMCSRFDCF